MKTQLYRIVDREGVELPQYYKGRDRTKEEADKILVGLNKNSEHRPYRAEPSYIADLEEGTITVTKK